MVLRYYGDDINERKLFHQGRIKPWKGTWDVTTAQSVLKKGYAVTVGWTGDLTSWNIPLNISKRYWKEYKKAIRKGMRHEKDSTISKIKKYLNKKVPVMAEVHAGRLYKKKYDWTHMIVITGYDEHKKIFYYHDPDKKMGGKKRTIAFITFKKIWEQLYPGVGRSIMIVEKRGSRISKDL